MYPELFASWQLAMGGKIPDQHLVDLFEINPSLLLAARDLMDHAGLGDSKAATFATYAFAALALVLVPFALSILRMVTSEPAQAGGSLLVRLDRWLMDHPRVAMRITVFAMFALYLSSPRLKEYAFFELALYAAILVVDLPALALAAFLAVGLAFPALISILGTAFEGSFILLIIALTSFWILLLDFRAGPKRLENWRGTAAARREREAAIQDGAQAGKNAREGHVAPTPNGHCGCSYGLTRCLERHSQAFSQAWACTPRIADIASVSCTV